MERNGERTGQNGDAKPGTQEAAASMVDEINQIADLGFRAMLDGSRGIFVPSRRRLRRRLGRTYSR